MSAPAPVDRTRPSTRYEQLADERGRVHLRDRTIPEPQTAGDRSGIVCDLDLWRWPIVAELGPVDDTLIGAPRFGGSCTRCFRIAWVAKMHAVLSVAGMPVCENGCPDCGSELDRYGCTASHGQHDVERRLAERSTR